MDLCGDYCNSENIASVLKSNEYNERVYFVKNTYCACAKQNTLNNICGVDYIERTCKCTCIIRVPRR